MDKYEALKNELFIRAYDASENLYWYMQHGNAEDLSNARGAWDAMKDLLNATGLTDEWKEWRIKYLMKLMDVHTTPTPA